MIPDLSAMPLASITAANVAQVVCLASFDGVAADPAAPAAPAVRRSPPGLADLVFRPTGGLLGAAYGRSNAPGFVRLWDLATQTYREWLLDDYVGLSRLAFSADQRVVAVGTDSGVVGAVALETGQRLVHWTGDGAPKNRVGGLTFTPDGRWLISGDHHGHLRVWNTTTWHLHHAWSGGACGIDGLTVSPSGRFVAGQYHGYEATIFRVWERETAQVVVERVFEHDRPDPIPTICPAFLPHQDTLMLIVAWESQPTYPAHTRIEQIQVPSGDRQVVLEQDGLGRVEVLLRVLVHPTGSLIAWRSDTGWVLWDRTLGGRVLPLPHGAEAWCLALSPDGTLLATGDVRMGVQIWGIPTGAPGSCAG